MGAVGVELRICLLAASLRSAGLGHPLLLSCEEPYRSDLGSAPDRYRACRQWSPRFASILEHLQVSLIEVVPRPDASFPW